MLNVKFIVLCFTCMCILYCGGSKNLEKGGDNVSAPSSFIANAQNELQGGPKI